MSKKLHITQTKSSIGASKRQKRNLEALGLRKINQTIEHKDNSSIRGMVRKVEHLVIAEIHQP